MSYDQKPNFPTKCQHPQQQYGKAFQYVKSPDGTETRAFIAVRIPQTVQPLQADHTRQAQLPPSASDSVLRSVSPANSDTSKRPTRPPDYETALQRLEMMKERQRTASPDCLKLSAKPVPEVPHTQQPLQQQQVPELNKRRKAALKKCVTFSDEVVLVACAEEEESDYLPNPLLERVYRQHAAKQDSKECQDFSQTEDLNSVHSSDSCDSVYQGDAATTAPDSNSQVPCNLCHKKSVSPPIVYCPDCAFYMSRFQKRT